MFDFQNSFNGMFGKIAPGMCRLTMNGKIAVKCSNGYKSYNVAKGTDTGKDTYDTTPSNTGILYSLEMLENLNVDDITAHYVTRPYLTRHGDGQMEDESKRQFVSKDIKEDRTNHSNDFQGDFRFGHLDIDSLYDRVKLDSRCVKFELDVTHCDEMDRISEFKDKFGTVNIYDTPLV